MAEEILKEDKRYKTPGLFWCVLSSALTLSGLFFTINRIFSLNLLGKLEIQSGYLYLLFACFLSQAFIFLPATKMTSKRLVPWYDVVFFFITFTASVYLAINSYEIAYRAWDITPPTGIAISAFLLCILALEALRRSGNLTLLLVCLFFALYPTFASHMPGFLEGAQFPLWFLAGFYALGRESLIGVIISMYGNMLIGFLIFGVVLVATGGGNAFMDFAFALFGSQKGGPAKVAIITSCLFGSVSGSVISNIITTGSFTIPAMKKAGYKPEFAAAVETVASTGGNIMPPIMGSTAFIMAMFLNISYLQVCKAALIPALLYYFALYLQVHCFAEKNNLRGIPKEDIPSLKQALGNVWPYFFAILLLVYFLYLGLEGRAPFISIIFLIILAIVRKKTRVCFTSGLPIFCKDLRNTLVSMIGMLTGIGFIVGSLSITGLGSSFSHEIVAIAGGNIVLVLIFTALGSLVLGMGMPVVPCYIFLSAVILPALLKSNIIPIAAHLFVFYWALASYLTPPVALGAATAAGLANANFLRTGLLSMRLGVLLYLLPFFFVFSPSLILQTSLIELILPLSTLILGIFLLAGSFEGYLIKFGVLSHFYHRILLFISGILLLMPGYRTDLVGISVFILTMIILLNSIDGKRETEEVR